MMKLIFALLIFSINAFAAVDPLLVDGSTVVQPVSGTFFQATQPVSGTVTSNQGTSPWVVSGTITVDTSLLATAANQTNRSQKTQISNGAIDGSIKAASTAALAADTSLVVGLSPNSPLPTGSNVLGALSANQSVNQTQVNGVAVSVGAGTTGTGVQRVVLPTDQTAIPVNATIVTSTLATYRAANISIALAALTTDFFTITGSASKTVKVIASDCNFTGGGLVYAIHLLKRSTANTAGTSTVTTAVPVDSTNAAATATVRSYTANPTLGTLVGALVAHKLGSPLVSGTVTPGIAEYNFSVSTGQPIVLRGTSEVLSWNGNGVTGSTNGSCDFTWTEE